MKNHHRNGHRRSFAEEVQLHVEGDPVPLDAVDISPSGVFLATEVLPEEGDEFELRFELPDGGDPVCVRGAVARVKDHRRDPRTGGVARPGIGVAFKDLPGAARDRLAQYAGSLDAGSHSP